VRMIGKQRMGLLRMLGDISGEAWNVPSPCEGWSVRDVLAHLVEGELAIGRIYRGEVSEQGFVDLTAIERWAALPAEAVRTSFWQHSEASERMLAGMDDARWASPIHAFGCSRISQLVRLHLFEGVVHGHDLSSPLGLTDPRNDEALAFAVAFAIRATPAALARHEIEPRGSIAFTAGDQRAVLAATEGSWRLVESPSADAEVSLDPGGFLLAATGRANVPDEAIAGDRAQADRVLGGWCVTR